MESNGEEGKAAPSCKSDQRVELSPPAGSHRDDVKPGLTTKGMANEVSCC